MYYKDVDVTYIKYVALTLGFIWLVVGLWLCASERFCVTSSFSVAQRAIVCINWRGVAGRSGCWRIEPSRPRLREHIVSRGRIYRVQLCQSTRERARPHMYITRIIRVFVALNCTHCARIGIVRSVTTRRPVQYMLLTGAELLISLSLPQQLNVGECCETDIAQQKLLRIILCSTLYQLSCPSAICWSIPYRLAC